MIDNNEYATCPYNSTHRVPRARIQHHLIKCQKNSSDQLMICPFNATHRYPEHLIKDHCLNCPNRRPDEPKPKVGHTDSIGAITTPKPILQKEYIPEQDPDNDYWDD